MKKIYYDTGPFWRFFINIYVEKANLPEELKIYSPMEWKSNIKRITSPWTLDEFFHNFIKSKRKEIKIPDSFFEKEIKKHTEILTHTKAFLALFSQESIDTRSLNELFITLFLAARECKILSLKQRDKKINSKDLLHLSYALCSDCHTFITCDNGFVLLKGKENIKKIISSYKLKKIIIIDTKLKKIIKKIDFSI